MDNNTMNPTAWDLAPYVKEPGVYEGELVRVMEIPGGFQLLLRTSPVQQKERDIALSAECVQYVFRERDDAENCIKLSGYFQGWRHCDADGEDAIEDLVRSIRKGDTLKVRVSASSRGNRCYVRYIKDVTRDLFSGMESEAAFMNEMLSSASYPVSGDVQFKISSLTHFASGGKDHFMVSAYESTDGSFGNYRLIIPNGTPAYKKTKASPEALSSQGKLTCRVVARNGLSYITDFPDWEKAKGLKKPKGPRNDYKAQKEAADACTKLLNDEFESTGGIYHGKVKEGPGVDYHSSQTAFVRVLLDDGREIMPEIRSKKTSHTRQAEEENAGSTNLLRHKGLLYPGLSVKLTFCRNIHRDALVLTGIFSSESEEDLKTQKSIWLVESGQA